MSTRSSTPPVQNIAIFRGFIRAQPVNIEDKDTTFEELPRDEIKEFKSDRQNLACAGCQRTFGKQVWKIKCGQCLDLDYPKKIVYVCCSECGDDVKLWEQFEQHVEETHGGFQEE